MAAVLGSDEDEGADSRSARFVREVVPLFGQLSRVAYRYTQDKVDAEDLVQEVMVRAYTSFDQFTGGTNARAWLMRILINTWITQHRVAKRRPVEVLTDTFTEAEAEAIVPTAVRSSVEAQVLHSLGDDELKRAMLSLVEHQRIVVYYVCVQGFRHKEVASMLDVPVATVMSRLHRGRLRLRTLLVDSGAASYPGDGEF